MTPLIATPKQVVVIAGPTGSGKDSIIQALLERCPGIVRTVTATTRAPRPGEVDGVNYHFFSKERFEKELAEGNILEHYHRASTDTYYGTYKPDLESRLAQDRVVVLAVQIVGARYIKEHYPSTTFFIMPESLDAFEHRIRSRAPMSDLEWQERREFTEREIKDEAPWYDYRIVNADGKLADAVAEVESILVKEGFQLYNA